MTDRFIGTHPDPVAEGGTLTIAYSNSELANSTVTVEVDNGEGDPPTLIEISLDSSGEGTAPFTVPSGWVGIALNGPDSSEHPVQVS